MISKRAGFGKRQAAMLDGAALLRIELFQASSQHRYDRSRDRIIDGATLD